MNTLGWLFILAGIAIARAVSRGRVMNIGEDLGDAFIAIVSGDTDALSDVFARKGEDAAPTAADLAVYKLTEGVTGGLSTAGVSIAEGLGDSFKELGDGVAGIAMAAILLGEKAKGYRWTATGPTYYDCSGLIWRACQAVGYKGSRFTTATMPGRKDFKRISGPGTQGPGTTAAGINDIVLWPAGRGGVTGHMGVINGPNEFYSARSVKSGIKPGSISGFRKKGPDYYRYVGPRKSVDPFK